jgi:hypothetical protein
MKNRRHRAQFRGGFVMLLLLVTFSARGGEPAPKERRNAALGMCREKNPSGARQLREDYEKTGQPEILFDLGECHESLVSRTRRSSPTGTTSGCLWPCVSPRQTPASNASKLGSKPRPRPCNRHATCSFPPPRRPARAAAAAPRPRRVANPQAGVKATTPGGPWRRIAV